MIKVISIIATMRHHEYVFTSLDNDNGLSSSKTFDRLQFIHDSFIFFPLTTWSFYSSLYYTNIMISMKISQIIFNDICSYAKECLYIIALINIQLDMFTIKKRVSVPSIGLRIPTWFYIMNFSV